MIFWWGKIQKNLKRTIDTPVSVLLTLCTEYDKICKDLKKNNVEVDYIFAIHYIFSNSVRVGYEVRAQKTEGHF